MKKILYVVVVCLISGAVYGQTYQTSKSSTPNLDEWLQQMIGNTYTQKQAQQKVAEPVFGTNVRVYTSNPKDPKTYGRKIRVEYPETWEAKPGVSPHNVYKFTDKLYANKELKSRSCLINIVNVEENISEARWKLLFLDPDFAEEFVGDFGTVLYSKATQVDSLPARMTMSEFAQEQLGIKIYQKTLSVSVGYKDTLISLMCMATADSKNSAANIFEDSKELFLKFMNSFKCMDRWENSHVSDDTNEYTLEEKLISMVKPDMQRQDYQDMVAVVAENAQIGGVCIKTQSDLTKIQKNPNVLLDYNTLGVYYMITHYLKDYCSSYTVPYNFMNQAKSKFATNKSATEKRIKNVMGNEYLSCITNDFLTSEESKYAAFDSWDIFRARIGVTKKDLCKEFNNEGQIPLLLDKLADLFKTMAF